MQNEGTTGSPVDNETYDLLQALTSKLEAIEAYGKYEHDMQGDARSALDEMAQQDRQHVERLVGLLRDRLGDGSSSGMSSGPSQMSGSGSSQMSGSGSSQMGGSGSSSSGQGTASAGD
jgi:hypothetical protein